MSIRPTLLAATFTLAFLDAAQADGVRPIQARSIDLGAMSGIAYYTVEREGFRIVTTLAQGEVGTPVRVVAVLAPGQSVVLSTPREAGVAPVEVEISRRGDRVLVREAAVTN
jgi:predicted aconitase